MSKVESIYKKAPLDKSKYTESFPDLPEFNNPLDFIVVGQGSAKSTEESSVVSEGFGKCAAITLKNEDGRMIGLIHDDSKTDTYFEAKNFMEKDFVNGRAIIFRSNDMALTPDMMNLFKKFTIKLLEEIILDVGSQHWGIAYRIAENLVYINNKFKSELQIFEGP